MWAWLRALFAPAPPPPVGRWCTHAARRWERKVDLSYGDYSLPPRRQPTSEEVAVASGYGLG